MEVRRIPRDSYCVVCDEIADFEVASNGSLHVFWACSRNDRELTLCRRCARELVDKLSALVKL